MSAEALVESIINNALSVATDKATQAANYADAAMAMAGGSAGGATITAAPGPASQSSIEPQVYIPNTAAGVDTALFNSTYGRIITDLSGQFATFFTTWFPNDATTLAKAVARLNDLLDGKSGIPAAIEDQLWQRDRARVLSEVNRASQETLATFAARGFPLPPGAAAHQVQQAQIEAQNKIAQSSRDVAIKQAEILIDNIKFAIGAAMDFRVKAIAAAGDYIRTLALGPELATRLATAASDSQARLISAASSYYNSRISLEELKLKASMFNASESNETSRKVMAARVEEIRSSSETAAALAKAAGDQAASALNAIHASASTAVQGEAA